MPISSPVSSVLSLLTKSNRQTIVKVPHLSKKNNRGTKSPAPSPNKYIEPNLGGFNPGKPST